MIKESLDKDPIQLNSGELGCPDCHTLLVEDLVPYFEDGSFLGAFSGLMCPMCHFGILSEKGYEDMGVALNNAGFIQKTALTNTQGNIVWEESLPKQITNNIFKNISKYDEEIFKMKSITNSEYSKPTIERVE